MEKYSGQTEEHVAKMVDQLRICDDFEEMLLECAMIAHQTDHVNALQNNRQRSEQPKRWFRPHRKDHSQNYGGYECSNARRPGHCAHDGQRYQHYSPDQPRQVRMQF